MMMVLVMVVMMVVMLVYLVRLVVVKISLAGSGQVADCAMLTTTSVILKHQ